MTPKQIVDVIAGVPAVHLTLFTLAWQLVDGETGELDPEAAVSNAAELEKALQEARSYRIECQQMASEINRCTSS